MEKDDDVASAGDIFKWGRGNGLEVERFQSIIQIRMPDNTAHRFFTCRGLLFPGPRQEAFLERTSSKTHLLKKKKKQ